MLLLAIDTAGPDCAVAVARGDAATCEVLASRSERIGRGHAEALFPYIDAVLADAGLGFADLRRIAVTTGPGSFTGVRIGVAAARGLALAAGIPAVGVSALASLAHAVRRAEPAGTAVALIAGGRGTLFARAEDVASGMLLFADAAVTPAELAERLRRAPRPLWLAGDGVPFLAPAFPDGAARIAGTAASPAIADVAALGIMAEPGASPVPLYLRDADARPQSDKAVARA